MRYLRLTVVLAITLALCLPGTLGALAATAPKTDLTLTPGAKWTDVLNGEARATLKIRNRGSASTTVKCGVTVRVSGWIYNTAWPDSHQPIDTSNAVDLTKTVAAGKTATASAPVSTGDISMAATTPYDLTLTGSLYTTCSTPVKFYVTRSIKSEMAAQVEALLVIQNTTKNKRVVRCSGSVAVSGSYHDVNVNTIPVSGSSSWGPLTATAAAHKTVSKPETITFPDIAAAFVGADPRHVSLGWESWVVSSCRIT